MLVVVTGPVRSGKSRVGLELAYASGRPIVVAVGARADDEEMARRIARHQSERHDGVTVVETPGDPDWLGRVPADACLLVDCLGTVLGAELAGLTMPDDVLADVAVERAAEAAGERLVDAFVRREGPTVVVTNEVGWGVVPASALGRLFRDVLGRANRCLIDAADGAWLVVNGRCVDLQAQPRKVEWPKR